MAESSFDVVVIGGGPGGYVAAIRAAQLGMSVACVESRGALGGTCLNVGCIPSKALLQSTEFYNHTLHHAKEHGIVVGKLDFDLGQMMSRKETIVKGLTGGIAGLFKKNKVTYVEGFASFVDEYTIEVKSKAKASAKQTLKAKNFVIATGSEPIELKIAPFDGENIVSSTEALSFSEVPKHLVVIGGGVIGLEMGSVWARLGAKVTVVEAQDRILATMDQDVSKEMTKLLEKQGFEIRANTKLKSSKVVKNKVKLICEVDGKEIEIEGDKVLVAVGRRAFIDGLNVDKAGVKARQNGKVETNNHLQTNVEHIYAIGDVIDGPMLAHKAEDEGVAVAEIIAGQAGHVNYEAIPGVVYTWPEVAAVGKTEQECKDGGLEYKIGKFPFMANGRARCFGETSGFVKIIADAKTDRLLGVHMVGPNVSELIAEVAVAFEFSASAEDLARSVHAHPTLAEAIKEAAMAVEKRQIHM